MTEVPRRRVIGCAGALALGGLAATGARAAPRALEPFLGRSRVLVVCAEATDDPQFQAQLRETERDPEGVKECDLVVVRAVGASATAGPGRDLGPSDALRRALRAPAEGFAAVLVGKDGGVKTRSRRPIPLKELFAAIDAMPMRIRERAGRGPGAP